MNLRTALFIMFVIGYVAGILQIPAVMLLYAIYEILSDWLHDLKRLFRIRYYGLLHPVYESDFWKRLEEIKGEEIYDTAITVQRFGRICRIHISNNPRYAKVQWVFLKGEKK